MEEQRKSQPWLMRIVAALFLLVADASSMGPLCWLINEGYAPNCAMGLVDKFVWFSLKTPDPVRDLLLWSFRK